MNKLMVVDISLPNTKGLFKVDSLGLKRIMDRGFVQCGWLNPSGQLKKVELRKHVSPIAAERATRLVSAAVGSTSISKNRQCPGARRWIVRLDKADAGRTANHTTLYFPLNQEHAA